MKGTLLIATLALAFLFIASTKYSHGIAGCTKKNGDGCVCHDFAPATGVRVWIAGPDSIPVGGSAEYRVYMTGGPKVTGGYNAAAAFGTLSTVDSFSQIMEGEVIHTAARQFINDTVSWKFRYTAPVKQFDTLYAVANSTNNDGNPTVPDAWNYSANFRIRIFTPVPVELAAFSGTRNNNTVTLTWGTATELNNKGFRVERKSGNEWVTLAFIAGSGTTTEPKLYTYSEQNPATVKSAYRLVQEDYNGTKQALRTIEIAGADAPQGFALEQNYPNPFNPSTTITFTTATAGTNTVAIYTAQGELARTIAPGYMQAGTFSYRFNAAGLPSGTYFCCVTSVADNGATYQKTIKMVLAK